MPRESPGIPFGFHIDDENGVVTPIYYKGDNCIITCGASGSGKLTDVLVPALFSLAGSESLVTIDPKGQAAAVCHAEMRRHSNVLFLNPYGLFTDILGEPIGFNPMASLRPDSLEFASDVDVLSEAIVYSENERDRYFTDAARQLWSGAIMYFAKYGQPEERNLVYCRAMIAGPRYVFREFIDRALATGDELIIERLGRFQGLSNE
jgi:type IV secretory pathway TraG/TraD family ATPase VirD4